MFKTFFDNYIIPDIKASYKYLSVQFGIMTVAWMSIPASWQDAVTTFVHLGDKNTITAVLAIGALVGRFVAQKGLDK